MYKLEKEKIIFSSDTKFSNFEFIGAGGNAIVYKLEIENSYYALKIFDKLQIDAEEDYKKMLNIDIPSFISPLKLSYIENTFNGYLMKYCNGINICESKIDMSISDFLMYSKTLISDTKKISNLRYLIKDVGVWNTLFDNGFKIVDLDFYEYVSESNTKFKSISDILKYNIKEINELIIDLFLTISKCYYKFYDNVSFQKLMNEVFNERITIDEMIKTFSIDEKNIDMKQLGKTLIKRFR